MGWLQRLFGAQKPKAQSSVGGMSNSQAAPASQATATPAPTQQSIPLERTGLNGEYDESGLAKRVALAFDEDPQVDDIDTVYVAQSSSTVILKGKVPSQAILSKLVSVARSVKGATGVETDQVTVG